METKRDKFVRLRAARFNKFMNLMRLFKNFSNKSNYEYTDEEVDELCNSMVREVEDVRRQLKSHKKFTL